MLFALALALAVKMFDKYLIRHMFRSQAPPISISMLNLVSKACLNDTLFIT